jgi:hypothetical protein
VITVKPTVPAVIDRFRTYHDQFPVWGSLHIVLDDDNVGDEHVRFAYDWAVERGDTEGARLAAILRAMTRTQRLKLARLA